MSDLLLAAPEVKTEDTTTTLSSGKEDHYCKTAGQGLWFFDRLEHNDSGPTIYRHLLEQAERCIRIWDPFLKDTDISLFQNIQADIDIRILTCYDSTQIKLQHQGFINEMTILQAAKHFNVKIAAIDKHKLNSRGFHSYGPSIPHDRFLFIDNRAFIVGSSLQYHSVENTRINTDSVSTTIIYEIQDPEQCNFLLNEFESYWKTDSDKYQYTTILPETGV